MSLKCGVLIAQYFNGRYKLPPAWRPLEPVNPLFSPSLDEALTRHHYDIDGEVWIYPLHAEGGPLVRPCREGNPDAIKRELNTDLFLTAIFADIDDREAHSQKRGSVSQWWENLESSLAPFEQFDGWFYYRTTRGARCGLLFDQPELIDTAQLAKLEFYQQLQDIIPAEAELDRACLDISRGFAAPHINKRGQAIPEDLPRLRMSDTRLSTDFVKQMANLYRQRSAKNSEIEPPDRQTSVRSRGGQSSRKSAPVIPEQSSIDELDGSQQYELTRSAFMAICKIVKHRELRSDILQLLDRHIMDGRRAQKESGWFDRQLEDIEKIIPVSNEANLQALPSPVQLSEFPELKPLRRVFQRSDDVELAEAILEVFGSDPSPIWHGDGIRKYDTRFGVWRLYGHHALRRIAFCAAGTKTVEGREVAISNSKTRGALEVLASQAGADQESPFDSAPAGVVIGGHFIKYSTVDGLRIEDLSPSHFAIHHLEYSIPTEVLTYWRTDGDEGRPPRAPRVFTDRFLGRSLSREPEEFETLEQVQTEIQAKIETIGEWLGLALLGACTMEATALIVHGRGSNGKSVLTSLVSDLFGPERTCHLPPQLMSERFNRAQLFGAVINVVSEMPESDLLASDTLKAVISGDRIEVERKHRDPFAFRPRAAHLFAANNLPSSRDRSHGLWRRLVPVEFTHIFTSENKDRHLIDKLRDEYDLLVPWALDLARQYFLRGGYAHENRIDQWRMTWRRQVDAVALYDNERLIPTSTTQAGTPIKKIYDDFISWCVQNGQSGAAKQSLSKFSRSICAIPTVQKSRHGKTRVTHINRNIQESNEWL